MPAEENLAFMLSDGGYDVWMTNSRGNINSKEHMDPINYNARNVSSKFYDFSWDEMAKHDVPSNLNYVLKMT